jgi:hypothetical protein
MIETVESDKKPEPVVKSDSVTPTERYLDALGTRSFLSLWSYPRIFRDQYRGKEICDLLVVFENDIIIFSDKHCAFKDTGRPLVDWGRWYRTAIQESAAQLWGAERWIRNNPHRLFLDQSCRRPFPLEIPQHARFHLVTVAHGAENYAKAIGKPGLMIDPSIVGNAHFGEACAPFKVGQLDPARGFVHVFDHTAVSAVMETVDTIQDFIAYLRAKETAILGGKLRWAASEQDLLAAYLGNPNEEQSFTIPRQYKRAHVPEGNWELFRRSPLRLAQIKANRISYYWDRLIESYGKHVLDGTLHSNTSSYVVSDNEKVLRLLAREPRTKRRELSRRLIEFVAKGEPSFRVILSPDEAAPLSSMSERLLDSSVNSSSMAYVFGATATDPTLPADEQTGLRLINLTLYCVALRRRYPVIRDIIGIAVEMKNIDPASMILTYIDARNWGSEQEEFAAKVQHESKFATNLTWRPSVVTTIPSVSRPPKNPRNKSCICGSGLKFKKCCGAAR